MSSENSKTEQIEAIPAIETIPEENSVEEIKSEDGEPIYHRNRNHLVLNGQTQKVISKFSSF